MKKPKTRGMIRDPSLKGDPSLLTNLISNVRIVENSATLRRIAKRRRLRNSLMMI